MPYNPEVSRNWVFTLNNPTEDETDFFEHRVDALRITVSREQGEGGTTHLQGAISFRRGYRKVAVRKLVPRAHWEAARAAVDANYCVKVRNPSGAGASRRFLCTDASSNCRWDQSCFEEKIIDLEELEATWRSSGRPFWLESLSANCTFTLAPSRLLGSSNDSELLSNPLGFYAMISRWYGGSMVQQALAKVERLQRLPASWVVEIPFGQSAQGGWVMATTSKR